MSLWADQQRQKPHFHSLFMVGSVCLLFRCYHLWRCYQSCIRDELVFVWAMGKSAGWVRGIYLNRGEMNSKEFNRIMTESTLSVFCIIVWVFLLFVPVWSLLRRWSRCNHIQGTWKKFRNWKSHFYSCTKLSLKLKCWVKLTCIKEIKEKVGGLNFTWWLGTTVASLCCRACLLTEDILSLCETASLTLTLTLWNDRLGRLKSGAAQFSVKYQRQIIAEPSLCKMGQSSRNTVTLFRQNNLF